MVSDGVAYTVADVMKGTLDYGTAACCDIPCPAAGKTGTTEEQADAWFVGYTPHVSTAVWVGNPDSRQPMPGYGADLAAPIWHDYMEVAAAQPCDDFPQPQNPASLSALLQRPHRVVGVRLVGRLLRRCDGHLHHPVDHDAETRRTDTGGGDNGYDPDLYAPGAGQDPAPTPGGGGDAAAASTPTDRARSRRDRRVRADRRDPRASRSRRERPRGRRASSSAAATTPR